MILIGSTIKEEEPKKNKTKQNKNALLLSYLFVSFRFIYFFFFIFSLSFSSYDVRTWNVPFVLFTNVILLRKIDQINNGFRREEEIFVEYVDLQSNVSRDDHQLALLSYYNDRTSKLHVSYDSAKEKLVNLHHLRSNRRTWYASCRLPKHPWLLKVYPVDKKKGEEEK